MNQTSITNYINIEEDYINQTNDAWQNELTSIEYEQTAMYINRFLRNLFVSNQNIHSAFEEKEFLELLKEIVSDFPSIEHEMFFGEQRNVIVIIQPEVVREAEEESLTEDLETTIKVAKESYPTLKRISLNLEFDPEIINRKTIRFTLNVSGKPEFILKNEELFDARLRTMIKNQTREQLTFTYEW
ncbi:MAG: hypothetical protein JW787_02380 [Sedimentisphaerales bacterium]|nr:hypothetical protein [Sedimentisphaerales bacterium]